MAIAQVVGRADQVKGAAVLWARGDAQNGLWRGDHAHHRTVLGHQHIAAAHHLPAWQENTQMASL